MYFDLTELYPNVPYDGALENEYLDQYLLEDGLEYLSLDFFPILDYYDYDLALVEKKKSKKSSLKKSKKSNKIYLKKKSKKNGHTPVAATPSPQITKILYYTPFTLIQQRDEEINSFRHGQMDFTENHEKKAYGYKEDSEQNNSGRTSNSYNQVSQSEDATNINYDINLKRKSTFVTRAKGQEKFSVEKNQNPIIWTKLTASTTTPHSLIAVSPDPDKEIIHKTLKQQEIVKKISHNQEGERNTTSENSPADVKVTETDGVIVEANVKISPATFFSKTDETPRSEIAEEHTFRPEAEASTYPPFSTTPDDGAFQIFRETLPEVEEAVTKVPISIAKEQQINLKKAEKTDYSSVATTLLPPTMKALHKGYNWNELLGILKEWYKDQQKGLEKSYGVTSVSTTLQPPITNIVYNWPFSTVQKPNEDNDSLQQRFQTQNSKENNTEAYNQSFDSKPTNINDETNFERKPSVTNDVQNERNFSYGGNQSRLISTISSTTLHSLTTVLPDPDKESIQESLERQEIYNKISKNHESEENTASLRIPADVTIIKTDDVIVEFDVTKSPNRFFNGIDGTPRSKSAEEHAFLTELSIASTDSSSTTPDNEALQNFPNTLPERDENVISITPSPEIVENISVSVTEESTFISDNITENTEDTQSVDEPHPTGAEPYSTIQVNPEATINGTINFDELKPKNVNTVDRNPDFLLSANHMTNESEAFEYTIDARHSPLNQTEDDLESKSLTEKLVASIKVNKNFERSDIPIEDYDEDFVYYDIV
ncbi:hypothetical protein Bhyg_02593 [Pseudolycoriella hygida]|uniref:Uncharacterized protein n=1 Tax=Pseudolycoriella hygida TaxID=35572 RepID=A0A9Q0ND73_9DIPT|nr:hypothetical protein Bhyg_02593 [Pseudolycoriella hygida]